VPTAKGGVAVRPAVAVLVGAIVLVAGCGCGVAHGNSSAGAGPAGVWTHTIVRSQLLATHSPDYLQPENLKLDVGRYRLTLSQGHGRLSKWNPISTFEASGTFTVHGDTIAFRWSHAVEHDAPNPPDPFCVHGAGCDPPWRLRWSLYRGMLTLSRVPDSTFQVPPAIWATAWQRQSP
jgi:hypothetical protein